MLSRGIPLAFSRDVHLFIPPTAIESARVHQVTQLRTDDVHCRKSAGIGPLVLKTVRVTDVAVSGITMDQ